jgi:hypothetical protein
VSVAGGEVKARGAVTVEEVLCPVFQEAIAQVGLQEEFDNLLDEENPVIIAQLLWREAWVAMKGN